MSQSCQRLIKNFVGWPRLDTPHGNQSNAKSSVACISKYSYVSSRHSNRMVLCKLWAPMFSRACYCRLHLISRFCSCYMFSRACHSLHDFPRLQLPIAFSRACRQVPDFPRLRPGVCFPALLTVTCIPALATSCMISHACNCYVFSRACHGLYDFPRLQLLHVFPRLLPVWIHNFPRACNCYIYPAPSALYML